MRRTLIIGGVTVFVAVILQGCSQKTLEPFRDAPTSGHDGNPAKVIEMPDGFSNISAKCDGPNMVYSAFHGDENRSAIAVVGNDPRCR